jgi:hypothetical protein
MELRARTRQLRRAAMMAALGALLVPASAGAKSHKTHAPTISSISPRILNVGDAMTVRGKYFRRGRKKNSVVFQRKGGRAVFVKATLATTKRLYVVIPGALASQMTIRNGVRVSTRFYLRVYSTRLGKRYTSSKLAPVIGPKPAKPTPPPPSAADGDCDHDGITNRFEGDDDNDLLDDATETAVGTDPLHADSDRDGMGDAFEYWSARDLNDRNQPYPGKRPYPNPLDGSDANIDFDGDGLTLFEEAVLWRHTSGKLPLDYSDGDQDTNPAGDRTPANDSPLNRDNDPFLTDDEKDGDGDGLTNLEETHGRMRIDWWKSAFPNEKPFEQRPFAQTSFVDPDSDGDGLNDAADDQDNDDVPNIIEISREASGQWTNPYNPCLPNPNSRTCPRGMPFGVTWAPFDADGNLPKTGWTTGTPPMLIWPRPAATPA